SLLQMLRDLVVPELNRRVADPAGDPHLFQQGRRTDRAGIEAEREWGHRRGLGPHGAGVWSRRGVRGARPSRAGLASLPRLSAWPDRRPLAKRCPITSPSVSIG